VASGSGWQCGRNCNYCNCNCNNCIRISNILVYISCFSASALCLCQSQSPVSIYTIYCSTHIFTYSHHSHVYVVARLAPIIGGGGGVGVVVSARFPSFVLLMFFCFATLVYSYSMYTIILNHFTLLILNFHSSRATVNSCLFTTPTPTPRLLLTG